MQKFCFLIYLFSVCLAAKCQGVYLYEPGFLKSDGYLKNTGPFSSIGNTASIAKCTRFSAGAYGAHPYAGSGLQAFAIGLAIPAGKSGFHFRLSQLNNDSFAEFKAGIGYARSLSRKWDIGIAFNYFSIALQGYGSSGAVAIDAGVVYHLSEGLRLGVQIGNPTRASFPKMEHEKLASSYGAGVGYDLSDKLFITAQIEKPTSTPISLLASIEYKFTDKLLAKGGLTTTDGGYFFGTGVHLQNIRLDALVSFHSRLGITPALVITYQKSEN
ncbi:MAG TPA: hypothetical protein VM935_12715 [Chitinophagaceae bacterium]|nr:hypothetical protein [Chitinophagaceae bacterium]